jgi:hypothetical protein
MARLSNTLKVVLLTSIFYLLMYFIGVESTMSYQEESKLKYIETVIKVAKSKLIKLDKSFKSTLELSQFKIDQLNDR